jgi:hypothetical protein
MHIEITNLCLLPVPITSLEGEGVAHEIAPGESFVIDDTTVPVAIFGEDPSFFDDYTHGASDVADAVMSVLVRYADRRPADPAEDDQVVCTIENLGRHPLRIIQGDDGVNDYEVAPGQSFSAEAHGFVEIRDLDFGAIPRR